MTKAIIIFGAFSMALFLLCSNMELTFRPFSIKLESWQRGLGILFLAYGLILLCGSYYFDGYKKGLDKGMDAVIEHLKTGDKKDENTFTSGNI